MGFFTKLMDNMRLNNDDDDDYFAEDEYAEDDKPAKRGYLKKNTDAYDDEPEEETSRPRFLPRTTNNNKVVPLRRSMEVSLVKPTSLDNAKEVCDNLLLGKAVVLNMEGIHTETAQRIIDFTSGACYSLGGSLHQVSSYIFVLGPYNVDITGDLQNILGGSVPSVRVGY